jgi:hypothetical protein
MRVRGQALAATACGLWAAGAFGDTLVLRSGDRVDGELLSVRGDTIEFREDRGRDGRVQRFRRSEVARIELEEWNDGGSDIGDTRPSGMRERYVSVPAAKAWTDTGVQVRAGQTVYFEASGTVRWGPDRRDGPGGEGGSHYNANRPIPGRPGAALVGKVGEGSDVFFIGDERGPIRVRASGRLMLGINDDHLPDNSGSFRVTIYY